MKRTTYLARDMQLPMVIAHRGASSDTPGNTLEAFRHAIDYGADMIEFDVRRTKDRILIAYHDEAVLERSIGEWTYGDIEAYFRPKGIHVPQVVEVLNLAKGRIQIDVEIKEEGYESEVIALVMTHFDENACVVTSFNDASLRAVKRMRPTVRTGLILGRAEPDDYVRTRISELFPMRRTMVAGADLLIPHYRLLKFGFLRRAESNRIPVFVWTVNDKRTIQKLMTDRRVGGIITDRPDIAVAVRNRASPP